MATKKKQDTNAEKTVKSNTTKKGDVIIDCGKEYKELGIKLGDIHALIDVALQLRFLIMTLLPEPKKGSVGDKIMDDVDKLGPQIRNMAKKCGHKITLFGEQCKEGKCNCKKCKCEKSDKKGAKRK